MNAEIKDVIDAIEKPLLFARKNDFRNLPKIKGLEILIKDLSSKALALKLTKEQSVTVNQIRSAFSGYNSKSSDDQKNVINQSVESLKIIKGSIVKAGSAEESASQESKDAIRYTGRISETSIRYLKGVGPVLSKILSRKGVMSIKDILYYFPRRYEDRRDVKRISQLTPGKVETVTGKVILAGKVRTKTRRIYQIVISDGTGTLSVIWFQFNEKYLSSTYKRGVDLILSGLINRNSYDGSLQIIHPKPEDIEIIEEENIGTTNDSVNFNRIVPIYPLTEGIQQRRVRNIIKNAIDSYSGKIVDYIPKQYNEKRNLIQLEEAVKRIHFPDESDGVVDFLDRKSVVQSLPHRSFIYNEFFLMEIGLSLRKTEIASKNGIMFKSPGELYKSVFEHLPFDLTNAQRGAIDEISKDMCSEKTMNRLLQGDVGSRKTIVAISAILNAVEDGYQAAMMAPTEILAEQHSKSVAGILRELDIKIVLLKSSISNKEKKLAYEKIKSGEVQIIIGTHALIQEELEYHNLGLAVIDEQHRFGVVQRAVLREKGEQPDILIMSATPIPRTLAMTVYGDLDVSTLDEMPPGRKKVETKIFFDTKKSRAKVYALMDKEIKEGRQAYIVYPLIEESENEMFKDLKFATKMAVELQNEVFPEYRVGLLHGKMKNDEKENIMNQFVKGQIDILVSTTVIEVGVDVSNASIMVVENSERFGLTQLHQLRGRIGRGQHDAVCILLTGFAKSEVADKRLSILENTSSGFKIAEADLMLRGPGDFLGTSQSGIPQFYLANLIRDFELLKYARDDAFELTKSDPGLSSFPGLLKEVYNKWGEFLHLATIS